MLAEGTKKTLNVHPTMQTKTVSLSGDDLHFEMLSDAFVQVPLRIQLQRKITTLSNET